MKKHRSIRYFLYLLLGFFITSFLLLAVFAGIQFKKIMVRGPLYKEIIQSKDIIADVLPPPLYIIESFHNVLAMTQQTSPEESAKLVTIAYKLEAQYYERLEYWKKNVVSGQIPSEYLMVSSSYAKDFFTKRNQIFIPLIHQKKFKEASQYALGTLNELFIQHKNSIEQIVNEANQRNKFVEESSKKIVLTAVWTIAILSSLFFIALLTLISLIIREEKKRRAISDEYYELMKAKEDLQQKTNELTSLNKELESFSYTVSHDLRAPLRGINGWTTILIEDYQDQLDLQAKKYLESVRFESIRMGNLIDDLLKLAHISRVELDIQELNLSDIVLKICERQKENSPERIFQFDIESDIFINGDRHLIEIALNNLIENACKFTSKKPVAIISFGKKEYNSKISFYIKDNGCGFNMNTNHHLFEPFYRMHRTSEFPGTGIGLAVVKKIIEIHKGKVWADAEKDKGATFYFTISTQL